MILNPTFYEKDGSSEKGYDLFSRLLKDRIILIFNEINDDLACSVIAQLLYLESLDPDKEISVYINSPGGSVSAGFGIYDTMRKLKCDVSTICVGMAASMGAFLLSAGTKGKRYALENSQIMIHQVLGGARGQASDIILEAKQMQRVKDRLNKILAENTGHSIEDIEKDTDRNNWMFAEDALEYGIIDRIISE
ncbi:MAG: ATP-dependent Clp protease proteolytic subunit [Acutalibacteraceae bacterium]|nr:ATP-dependent Clp protease proteolytic subunit [Acutalibacteraceae bacterium]